MNKRYLNIGGIIGLVLVVGIMYDLLLNDKVKLLSIDTVQALMNHWARHWHVLAVGLLPVYVALVFFGTVLGGLYFGSALQRWLGRFFPPK